jgi:hypothetical protein
VPFPRKFLNDGEDIVLDLHPHWWYFVKPVSTLVLLLVGVGFAYNIDYLPLPKPQSVQNAIYAEMERSQTRSAQRATTPAQLSVPEQIEKLDELRQRGVISQAEFDAKKAQLLDRM